MAVLVAIASLARRIGALEPVPPDLLPENWTTTVAARVGVGMARKLHSDEDILKLLREIEVKLTEGNKIAVGLSMSG